MKVEWPNRVGGLKIILLNRFNLQYLTNDQIQIMRKRRACRVTPRIFKSKAKKKSKAQFISKDVIILKEGWCKKKKSTGRGRND